MGTNTAVVRVEGDTTSQTALTFAKISAIPPSPLKQIDTDGSISGGQPTSGVGTVQSEAGPFNPGDGRYAFARSRVVTSTSLTVLSVTTKTAGAGMKAIGFAQKGVHRATLPVQAVQARIQSNVQASAEASTPDYAPPRAPLHALEFETFELQGRHALLDFRLTLQPERDDLLQSAADFALEESDEVAGLLSRDQVIVYRLAVSLGTSRDKPGIVQVRNEHDCRFLSVDHEIDERDFEFDFDRRILRYIGRPDNCGNRSTRINISFAPDCPFDTGAFSPTLLSFDIEEGRSRPDEPAPDEPAPDEPAYEAA